MQIYCKPQMVSRTTHPISSADNQWTTLHDPLLLSDNCGARLLPVGRGELGEFGKFLYSPCGCNGAIRIVRYEFVRNPLNIGGP